MAAQSHSIAGLGNLLEGLSVADQPVTDSADTFDQGSNAELKNNLARGVPEATAHTANRVKPEETFVIQTSHGYENDSKQAPSRSCFIRLELVDQGSLPMASSDNDVEVQELDIPLHYDESYPGGLGTAQSVAELPVSGTITVDHKINLSPDNLSDQAMILSEFMQPLLKKDERFCQLKDLDLAIACIYHAAVITPENDPGKAVIITNLGSGFACRYDRFGELKDLETAAKWYTHADSMTSNEDSSKPAILVNLGQMCYSKFGRLGHLEDLDLAINYQNRSVALTPIGDPNKGGRLNGLGRSHLGRFSRLGELLDLDIAIKCQVQALDLTSDSDPKRPRRFRDLGNSYHASFKRFGDPQDLHNAIEAYTNAANLTPDEHPDKPLRICSAAKALGSRYERFGNLEDLNTAIDFQFRAVSLSPNEHPSKPHLIHELGNSFCLRFSCLGNLVDLDSAINCYGHALELTPDNDPGRLGELSQLGSALSLRFERLGEQADIDLGIRFQEEVLLHTPEGYATNYEGLQNLGTSYLFRFKQYNQLTDIDMSISYHSQALLAIPVDHPMRQILLGNLGGSYTARFEKNNQLEDLWVAIDYLTQAVELMSDEHTEKPARLNNLGLAYSAKFQRLGEINDIQRAIEIQTRAVSLVPDTHSLRPLFFHHLGMFQFARFSHSGEKSDGSKAIDWFKQAAQSVAGNPLTRLQAANSWAKCSLMLSNWSPEAYQYVLKLIPQVVWLGSTTESRYKQLISIQDMVLEASTMAILSGNYDQALEWLDEGRSIVWKQLLQLRNPLNELQNIDASLAQELKQVAQELDHTTAIEAVTPRLSTPLPPFSQENTAQKHRRLAEKWESLVEQARSRPSMSEFLLPTKSAQLVTAAHSSAVVVISVHPIRCNALIIMPQTNSISHVDLPNLSRESTEKARVQLMSLLRNQGRNSRGFTKASEGKGALGRVLYMLWTDIVHPVLKVLGYTKNLPTNELPRITWCSTGPLSFLPLHAAGDYSEPGSAVFDYAISSYTPTLSALAPKPISHSVLSGILAVGQASTSGLSPLPGTIAEIEEIGRQAGMIKFTRLEGDDALKTTVLEKMGQHSWVHFACHASQNSSNPMSSAFHLHDGALDLATITQKPLQQAELAFLSACQTATGDERLPEEAIHLASGMIMMGYRTVIATMWSVDDLDAPLIAQKFYANMLEARVQANDHVSGAVALHNAVKHLRSVIGVELFERWVPYIHIGH